MRPAFGLLLVALLLYRLELAQMILSARPTYILTALSV